MSRPLLVATRSPDKLREMRQLLAGAEGVEIIGLEEAGVEVEPLEDGIERFETFEENALAKARFFAERTGLATLADDSGLCVDAIGGAPGIRSKRFAARPELSGSGRDAANNRRLLRELQGVPRLERSARYVCVVAYVDPAGSEALFRGTCDGVILEEPRGSGGFGYDPLFFIPSENATFAELPAAEKHRLSHRGSALRKARKALFPGT